MQPRPKGQKLQSNSSDVGDIEVVCIKHPATFGERKGVSCQHLQVTMPNMIQKHWEWQEEKNPVMKHGTLVRPTLYLASLGIKTAFDEARPQHVAKILDRHNTHGWIIAAFLREMLGLERPCLNAWKAISLSIDVCDREAWKLHACGKRWQPRCWPTWRKKKNG